MGSGGCGDAQRRGCLSVVDGGADEEEACFVSVTVCSLKSYFNTCISFVLALTQQSPRLGYPSAQGSAQIHGFLLLGKD